MSEMPKILLGAGIQNSDNIIKSLNSDIEKLQSKVKPMKIKVEIDTTQIESINTIVNNLSRIGKSVDDINKKKINITDTKQTKDVQDTITAVDKLTKSEKNYTDQLEKRIAIFKRTKQLDIGQLETKYSGMEGLKDLDSYKNKIDSISVATPNATHQMALLNVEMRELKAQLKDESDIKKLNERVEIFKRLKENQLKDITAKYGDNIDPSSLNAVNQALSQLSSSTPNVNHQMKLINASMRELSTDAKISAMNIGELGNSFWGATKQMTAMLGINLSLYALFGQIRNGVKSVNDLDASLTQIAMVTNSTRDQVAGLAQEYNNLAKEMRVTTAEVAEGAVLFYRQGLAQEEVMERLRATTMFSKVTNLEFVESAELITATVNAMGISVERATDVFTLLGDSAATSGAEIAKGFSKVSGTTKALNLEFEKVSAYIATISAVTRQNAESIGTALNAIFSRMTNMTAKGFTEEGKNINNVAKSLKEINILVEESPGKWKKQTDVLDEVASKWDTLNDRQKAYVATTIAGTRQQSTFYNLMENYTTSLELYDTALDAAGTTQEKYGIYLESNQAKMDLLKATVEELWITLLDSDGLMKIVELMTRLVEVVIALTDAYGGNIVAVAKVVGSIFLAVTAFTKLYGAIDALILLFKQGISLISAWSGALTGIGTTTAIISPPIFALTLALGALAVGLTKVAMSSKDAERNLSKALDKVGQTSADTTQLTKLSNEYERLSRIENKTTEETQRLLNVQRDLARLYPELTTAIDTEGQKMATNLDLVQKLAEEKQKDYEQTLANLRMMADLRIPELNEEIDGIRERIAKVQQYMNMTSNPKLLENYRSELISLSEQLDEVSQERSKYNSIVAESEILEAQHIETIKWQTAERIAHAVATSNDEVALSAYRDELIKVGFTYRDTSDIMAGKMKEVKERQELLTGAFYEHIAATESMDDATRQSYITRLNTERALTTEVINQTKARIKAIQAEQQALIGKTKSMVDPYGFKPMIGENIKDNPFASIIQKEALDPVKATLRKNEAYMSATKELQTLETQLNNIDKALAAIDNISVSASKNVAKVDPASKKGKTKKEYKAESDRYAELNRLLQENTILTDRNNLARKSLEDGTDAMVKSLEKEVALNKQRQSILHALNQERRLELKQLESSLSKQGFRFEGTGDNRIITNLEAVQGKTREVEDAIKRYVEIQSRLLGEASNEWAKLQNSIDDISLEIVTQKFQVFDRSILELKESMEELDYQMKMLDTDDLDGKLEITAKQMVLAQIEAENLQAELERLRSLEFSSKEAGLYNERIKELEKAFRDASISAKEFESAIASMREDRRVKWIAEQNRLYQEQQSALDKIQEKLVQIIRKRGDEEKKALKDAHDKELQSLKERHDKRKQTYKDDVDNYKKLIEEKLRLMEEEENQQDYNEQLEKERQKALELQRNIDVLTLDDSLEARTKVIQLRKDLADQNEKIAKMQNKRERDIEKQALRDKLKDKDEEVKIKDELSTEWYENEKKRLEEDYQINKDFLDRKYADDQVYAEARESIIRGTVEVSEGAFMDIYDAFESFEDKFGKGMGILGQIIKDDFIAELDKAREAISRMDQDASSWLRQYDKDYDPGDDALGWENPDYDKYKDDYSHHQTSGKDNRPQEFRNWSDSDFQTYIKNKQEWELAADRKDDKRKTDLAYANAMLRKKYWGDSRAWEDKYHWKQLIGSYDKGGFIPRDGVIMAHEQEMYIPTKMQRDLWNALENPERFIDEKYKTVTSNNTNAIQIEIPVYGNLDNVTLSDVERTVVRALNNYDERQNISLRKRGL